MREIIHADVRPSWTFLLVLSALHLTTLSLEVDGSGSLSPSRSALSAFSALFQFAFGIVVGPILLAAFGGWLGGRRDAADIRESVVWSYVPFAVGGFLWIPELVKYGPALSEPPLDWFPGVLLLGALVSILWTIALSVVTLAEVQRLTIFRAALTVAVVATPLFVFDALWRGWVMPL